MDPSTLDKNTSLWNRIKARHLDTDIYAIVVSAVAFIISSILYYAKPINSEMFYEFQLALSTSLLAAIFISTIDLFNKYKNFENAVFIDNLYEFGIKNLHFDKKDVLCELIRKSNKVIWISGYRLILTKQLAREIHDARNRGVSIRMLLCPPWSYTHSLVYSDVDRSLDRYIDLFSMIVSNDNSEKGDMQIRFTEKPLFNDTYLCDNTIITSPYLHNKDIRYGVITASDFFTYEVKSGSQLFDLIEDEYQTIFDEAKYEIREDGIRAALARINDNRMEKTHLDKASIITEYLQPTREEDTAAAETEQAV